MKVAIAYEGTTANVHYRAVVPATELARRRHTVYPPGHPTFRAFDERLPAWDVLLMHQFVSDYDLATAVRLREAGIAVVWDTDDDIAAAPKGSRAYRRHGRRGLRRCFERTVEMARTAHLMTTTNERLAEVYRAAGVEHVQVIDNHLDARDVGRGRRRHAGVVIGCTAADEHRRDLDALRIGKLLAAILREREDVRVVAIGQDLGIRDPRYTHHPLVPIGRLIEMESDWDIGLAPLAETRLNRSRSNVKLKEYAAAGATWLASPVGPYAEMGPEQGGRLVADDDWHDAITELLDDPRLRVERTRRAGAWARTQTIERAGAAWEGALRAAVARARHERVLAP